MGKKVSAATMSDMGRRPTPLDIDATAAAVRATQSHMAAVYAVWCLLRAGNPVPRSVGRMMSDDRVARAHIWRVIRSAGATAPIRRPEILDAATRLSRGASVARLAEMIETLRVTHDIAERADVRAAVNNTRGVVMARYFRRLGNERIGNGRRGRPRQQ
jgi:hypothetical protein